MATNWLLTFRFINASTWLDRKLTLRSTSEGFLSFSAWFWDCFKLDCIYIQIRAGYCRHCFVNWSSQLKAFIVREQLLSFDPCHYLLPLFQKVNKLITNDEMRDDNNNRRVTPTVKCEPNHTKYCEINNGQSVNLDIVFASSNNFHVTSHHSGFENKTKQVRFYLI